MQLNQFPLCVRRVNNNVNYFESYILLVRLKIKKIITMKKYFCTLSGF